jgi:NAD(P)-dependent dehydrogenase (short-subunit alcohol dehydrogenase family)
MKIEHLDQESRGGIEQGPDSRRLRGKRALITGGGSGIGRAATIKIAREGGKVAVLDVRLEAAQQVAQEITSVGGEALALAADVAVESEMIEAVSRAEARFNGIDTIIANAGIFLVGQDAAAADLDLKVWQRCIDVNLTGMFLTCKYGLKALQRNGKGSIVITGSPTGTRACAPTFTAYSASKAGALGLMRILAIDYVSQNIRVNAVLPGTTKSPLVTELMSDPEKRARYLAKVPMTRAAEPEEIANVIAFLASDEASFVTGAEWYADGGQTAT